MSLQRLLRPPAKEVNQAIEESKEVERNFLLMSEGYLLSERDELPGKVRQVLWEDEEHSANVRALLIKDCLLLWKVADLLRKDRVLLSEVTRLLLPEGELLRKDRLLSLEVDELLWKVDHLPMKEGFLLMEKAELLWPETPPAWGFRELQKHLKKALRSLP